MFYRFTEDTSRKLSRQPFFGPTRDAGNGATAKG
jgi:hypothetical protein